MYCRHVAPKRHSCDFVSSDVNVVVLVAVCPCGRTSSDNSLLKFILWYFSRKDFMVLGPVAHGFVFQGIVDTKLPYSIGKDKTAPTYL